MRNPFAHGCGEGRVAGAAFHPAATLRMPAGGKGGIVGWLVVLTGVKLAASADPAALVNGFLGQARLNPGIAPPAPGTSPSNRPDG
ncbi:MAG: hypothetical protein ACHQ5A_14090 [Opitutales bacterium]